MNSINSMEILLLLILSLLCLVLAGSNACLPDEEYWKSVLPNTPLPKALQDLSQPCEMERKGTFLDDDMVTNNRNDKKYKKRYQKHYHKTYDHMHHGPTHEESKSKSTLSADDLSGTTLFYSYYDLYPGRKMTLPFENAGNQASFLPHDVANLIPFSSDHLSEILDYFSIKTESEEAEFIKDTIEECEAPNRKGEVKLCPTSLKSMIDFVVARLGRNVKVLSNQSGKEQEYTVLMGMRKIGDKPVTCHRDVYPYAVYYCHQINGTEVFVVPLIAADGTKVKAIAICHKSFELLKAKPGTTICHFLANDTLVWVQPNDPAGYDLAAQFSKPGIEDQQVGVSLM